VSQGAELISIFLRSDARARRIQTFSNPDPGPVGSEPIERALSGAHLWLTLLTLEV
jgi:hypothetical protein